MLTPRIDLAYADSLDACLTIEDHQPCLNNPRWIEENWSSQEVNDLKRTRDDLEESWDEYDLETKRSKARKLVQAQVCRKHQNKRLTERLYTKWMIRGFARDGPQLDQPRIGDNPEREFTNVQQIEAHPTVSERSPEVGRGGLGATEEEMSDDHDESLFLPDSSSTTPPDSSFTNPLWPEASEPLPQTDGSVSATSPAAETDHGSSQPAIEEQSNSESDADYSSAVNDQSDPHRSEMQPSHHDTALERLMLRSVILDHEDEASHLRHQFFTSKLETAYWRDQYDRLAAHLLKQASENVALVAASGR